MLELIITITVMLVLVTAAVPVIRITVIRQKEWELRRDLREMRTAIDRYKDVADTHYIQSAVGSEGYPPDLDTLVKGAKFGSAGDDSVRFLRRIPVDPMTGHTDWVLRSLQDDADSDSYSGGNVFDVHSSSHATALDGTLYSTW